jgi:hypothetical protein
MARKTSLYVDAAGDAIIDARNSDRSPGIRRHGQRSQIFRELLRRYDEICRTDVPELAESDWGVLLAAGSDWIGKEGIDAGVRIARLLTAASARKDEGLMKRLFDLGPAHRIVVVDFIERYWAAKKRGDTPPDLPSVSYETERGHSRRPGGKKGPAPSAVERARVGARK